MEIVRNALQLIVAIAILSVWLFRPARKTPYRGAGADSLPEEFAAYGLPLWFMVVVGIMKVTLALGLLAAIWIPVLAAPLALGLGLLMLGALAMHLKVRDPIRKMLPASAILLLCLAIAVL